MIMNEWTWIILLSLGGFIFLRWGVRWWRNRKAGKQADELLSNVIRGKDAFRR